MNKFLITGFCLLTLTSAVLLRPAAAQEMKEIKRTVTVRGEASRQVSPDQATVNFSIVTRSKDPNLARSLNAEAGARAIKSIVEAGVPKKSIRLENLILSPAREWNPDSRKYVELGYDVTRSVQVTLENLDLVPEVVVRVVESGANRLEGVRYGLKSDTDIRTAVLAEAVVSAKHRAAAMVAAVGSELGEVLTINEEGMSVPTPYVGAERMVAQKAMADESQALPAGDIEVSATVVVTFSIQ